LLEAVERVRPVVVAGAEAAEVAGTLPLATVDALDEAGLLALKLPEVLGGAEADPVTQFEVIEAMAAIDASTAWCMMVGATALALPAAFLSDEAIAQMFDGGRAPRAAGVFMPTGQAIRVAGGFRVTGRWAFASGIRHSRWVSATARGFGGGEEMLKRYTVVFPTAAVHIHDNWQVAGLQGTGSCDFSAADLFVPAAFAWDSDLARPYRGGPLYGLSLPGFVANEHAALAVGIARRALNTLVEIAESTQRGLGLKVSLLASRPTVQRAIARADLQLRAARALAIEVFEEVWAVVAAGGVVTPRMHCDTRGVATFATEVALDVTESAFRYAGGRALFLSHALQRCWRDMNAAAQHVVVSDVAYENHGQFLLGVPGAEPMG
jgi:alkylation response protein AidB-like acyl-CoA dehydrogenase